MSYPNCHPGRSQVRRGGVLVLACLGSNLQAQGPLSSRLQKSLLGDSDQGGHSLLLSKAAMYGLLILGLS